MTTVEIRKQVAIIIIVVVVVVVVVVVPIYVQVLTAQVRAVLVVLEYTDWWGNCSPQVNGNRHRRRRRRRHFLRRIF